MIESYAALKSRAAHEYLEGALPLGQWAAASQLLGHNHAFIQQYIRRGKPKFLSDPDRAMLVRLYELDPDRLAPPEKTPEMAHAMRSYRARLALGDQPGVNPQLDGGAAQITRKAQLLGVWDRLPPHYQGVIWGLAMSLAAEVGLGSDKVDSLTA